MNVNLQNEIRFVGSMYLNPELLVDYGHYIRPKYDFADAAVRFFYECADLMYRTVTQDFSKVNIVSFMTQESDRFQLFKLYGGYNTIEFGKISLQQVQKKKLGFVLTHLKNTALLGNMNAKGTM